MNFFTLIFCTLALANGTAAIDGMQTLPSYLAAESLSAGGDIYEDLTFHGGKTLTHQNSISVYLLWYGDGWKQSDGSSVIALVKEFVSSVSTSSWWRIVQSFGSGSAQLSVSGELQVSANTLSIDRSEATKQLSQVIGSGSGQFPDDPNAIYVLIPADNIVTTDGFCREYCAYHTGIHEQTNILQFAFVGNPTQCLFNCSGLSITGRLLHSFLFPQIPIVILTLNLHLLSS